MSSKTPTICIVCLLLAACSPASVEPQYRGFDLHLHHPSHYATYMMVSPGIQGADLPKPREIESRAFSEYLRAETGCVLNSAQDVTPLGSRQTPAGYMVPIVCAPLADEANLTVIEDTNQSVADVNGL